MKFIKSKKAIALLATVAVIAIAAVGAYAYFSATGTGNGTATVGTSANGYYVVGTSATALTPNGPASTVSFTAYNYASDNESIAAIHLASVKACSGGTWTLPGTDTFADVQLAATCSGRVLPTGPGAGDCGSLATSTGSTVDDFSCLTFGGPVHRW